MWCQYFLLIPYEFYFGYLYHANLIYKSMFLDREKRSVLVSRILYFRQQWIVYSPKNRFFIISIFIYCTKFLSSHPIQNRVCDLRKTVGVTKMRRRWFETTSCPSWRHCNDHIMTSSGENIFRVTIPLCWNPPATTGFPSQRYNNADLWYSFVVTLNKLLNKHSIDR